MPGKPPALGSCSDSRSPRNGSWAFTANYVDGSNIQHVGYLCPLMRNFDRYNLIDNKIEPILNNDIRTKLLRWSDPDGANRPPKEQFFDSAEVGAVALNPENYSKDLVCELLSAQRSSDWTTS
jgi:hypothetical protein